MEGFRSADMNKATELVKRLDRSVQKAFPEMQKALDRSLGKEEKETFYKKINELILDGDLTKLADTAVFQKSLKQKGLSDETIGNLVDTTDDARETIGNLIKTTNKYNPGELKDILQERIKASVSNTYKIFEDAPFLGLFGRYKPTEDVKEGATAFFQKQLADAAGNSNVDVYRQQARDIVDKILEDGIKAKKSAKGLPDRS